MNAKEETISAEQIFNQLAHIKSRLETFPSGNHEFIALKDIILILIRTFAGEVIPELQLANIGGGVMEPQNDPGHTNVTANGEIMKGGIEIAPGVIQYPASPSVATMDVEASQSALHESLAPARAPVPSDMPKPVAGSLMAMAMQSEGKPVKTVPQEIPELSSLDRPPGVPMPEDTKVEITSPGTE